MRASSKKQWELFGREQRYVRREPKYFYAAVIFLPSIGCDVMRISMRQSRVNGCLRTNRELMGLARNAGWLP